MTSWRDSASQQAQDDFEELLNATLPFAEKLIGKRGTFVPFGAVVNRTGAVEMTGALGDDSVETLEMLHAGARQNADDNRAVAFLVDVRIPGEGDAIRFEVEHVEGSALEIVIPYRRSRVRRSVELDDMIVSEAERRIFE